MQRRTAVVLGIETSCDETGVALVRAWSDGRTLRFTVLKNLLYSQVPLHRRTGGVVPEVAAREHAVRLPRLLKDLGDWYGLSRLERMTDAIAVTAGPGLVTSLAVGVEVARTMSYVWSKPLVKVNHLEGHIYANLLVVNSRMPNGKIQMPNFIFPLLALIVSGGHTELVLMRRHLNYRPLGQTRDDAAGECFDKTARLLGLPYPGGAALSALARHGRPDAVAFPRPMLEQPNLDFSFAGLKTAVAIYLQKKHSGILKNTRVARTVSRADVAASIEQAIVETLVGKTLRAVERVRPRMVVLAGGVAANLPLRRALQCSLTELFPTVRYLEPALEYSTDNASMIAAAGALRYRSGHTTTWERVRIDPQLLLGRSISHNRSRHGAR
jgi:N6-L-threonylcarbamoyladenine synthase